MDYERKLSAADVRAWLSAVEADIEKLDEKTKPLLAQRDQLDERKQLLQGLLRSFDGAAANGAAPISPTRTGSVVRYVVDNAVAILGEEGHPMHINDLHAQFVERGLTVPGAGKPVNLTVHLRSAEEIVSPTRGMYGLVDHVGSAPHLAPPKKRRSTRRRVRGRKK